MKNFLVLILTTVVLTSFIGRYDAGEDVDAIKKVYESKESFLISEIDRLESEISKFDAGVVAYVRFRESLAHSESRGNPRVYNSIGARGKYQFTKPALDALGVDVPLSMFISNPDMWPEAKQDQVFNDWALLLESRLQDVITLYEGSYVLDSVLVTKSGVLAAAHLGGAHGVRVFLETGGKYNPSDGYSRISDYMYKFRGYNF